MKPCPICGKLTDTPPDEFFVSGGLSLEERIHAYHVLSDTLPNFLETRRSE